MGYNCHYFFLLAIDSVLFFIVQLISIVILFFVSIATINHKIFVLQLTDKGNKSRRKQKVWKKFIARVEFYKIVYYRRRNYSVRWRWNIETRSLICTYCIGRYLSYFLITEIFLNKSCHRSLTIFFFQIIPSFLQNWHFFRSERGTCAPPGPSTEVHKTLFNWRIKLFSFNTFH